LRNIALLCGGKSPEHEISVRSAKNILGAIDRQKFQVQLIGVDRQGQWRLLEESALTEEVPQVGIPLAIIPGMNPGQIIRLDNHQPIEQPEAIFLIMHGPQGEDGTIQGLLRILDFPFVGPDVLGSAVAMDKDLAKRVLREAGLKVARGQVFHAHEKANIHYGELSNRFGRPIFVKPANMGSSVGVHKVTSADELTAAVRDAFLYDTKILIEEMIVGRELECAVLGNENPRTTAVGEVITAEEYSYEAKYISQTAAQIQIPAKVSEEELTRMRSVAKQAYQALCCEGLSRVDMFLTEDGVVYVNEVNTLPGFTSISMYPKLWAADGIDYPTLIEELIQLAINRYQKQKALKTNWKD
jgi:D-alanine-D-alanine ligase